MSYTYKEIINGQEIEITRYSPSARSTHKRTKSLKELFPKDIVYSKVELELIEFKNYSEQDILNRRKNKNDKQSKKQNQLKEHIQQYNKSH